MKNYFLWFFWCWQCGIHFPWKKGKCRRCGVLHKDNPINFSKPIKDE